MPGWNFFNKRPTWGLELGSELALRVLQETESPKEPYPLQTRLLKTPPKGLIGVHDRWIIQIVETSPGVLRLTMNDTADQRHHQLTLDVSSEAQLRTGLTPWREKVAWWQGRLSIHRLQPGKSYRVLRPFTDYQGTTFEAGSVMTFQGQNFLPYEGGYTLSFQPRSIYLQEESQAEILENADAYFEQVP